MVASIKKIGGQGGLPVAGAVAYYEQEVRAELAERARAAAAGDAHTGYLAREPEAPLARWWSPGSTLMPDGAPVVPQDMAALLSGRRPSDGKSLVRGADRSDRISGWDITFSAPKHVSCLYAGADPATRRALLEDVRASAEAALTALHEVGGIVTRRGTNGRIHEAADGVAAALFPQTSNRLGSPALHCHAVLANVALRPDGKTGTIASHQMYYEKGFAAAVFRAELAERMVRRGLAVAEDRQFFKVVGVPEPLVARWSDRREQVLGEAKAGGDGAATRRSRARAAQLTRAGKADAPTGAALEAKWQADMASLGLTPDQVWASAREVAPRVRKPEGLAGDVALDDALSRRSMVRERELRRLIAEATQARGGGAEGVKAEHARLLASGRLLELAPDGQERVFTTAETLARERRMILDARGRIGEQGHIRAEAVESAIAARPKLAPEQQRAIRWAARGGGVSVIEGVAGAGKSYALGALAKAAQESGVQPIAVAPTWTAARVLAEETGAKATKTLQGLVKALDDGRLCFGAPAPGERTPPGVAYLPQRSLVIMDEASLAGSRLTASLLAHARKAGVQVVLVGDRKQLQAVEPGSPLAALVPEVGVARLEEVRRQAEPWMRQASVALSRHNVAPALDAYQRHGAIGWHGSAEDAVARLVERHRDLRAADPDADILVMAHRNSDVNALNAALRAQAMAEGRLGAEAVMVKTLQPGGFGGKGEVRDLELRVGDKVAPGVSLARSGRDLLPNDAAEVVALGAGPDPQMRLRVQRTGRDVDLRLSELKPPGGGRQDKAPVLRHDYARTLHKAQGATATHALLLAAETMTAPLLYVGMTRHRVSLTVEVDSSAIAERLREDGKPHDQAAVRAAAANLWARPGEGGNAADHVVDRERWLRTGEHGAAPPRPETGWRRTRDAVKVAMERVRERAQEAVHQVARAVRETVMPRPQQPRRERGRGMRL